MYGSIRHIRGRPYTFFYNGKSVKFSGIHDYQLVPLQNARELIQNGNFLPSEETFKDLKSIYYKNGRDPENMLEGKDCYIVGSGLSLRGFDFDKLKDKFTIAINHSVHYFNSSAVLFIDGKFLKDDDRKAMQMLSKYNGMIFAAFRSKYHLMSSRSENNVYYFSLNKHGVQKEYYNGLYSGKSSGLCAINLALIMNARRIFLLGFDYDEGSESKHFYNKKGQDKFKNERSYTKGKCKSMISVFRIYAGYNNIINCNPNSGITYFKYGGI